jgi:hypothetical protein
MELYSRLEQIMLEMRPAFKRETTFEWFVLFNTPDRFVTTENRISTESGSSYKVLVSSKPKQTALMNDIIHTLLAKVGFLANLSVSF